MACSDDDVARRELRHRRLDGPPGVLEREQRPEGSLSSACGAELEPRHVAEERVDHGSRLGWGEDGDVGVRAPAGCHLQQMAIPAREPAGPGEERQQDARPRSHVQNPGSGDMGTAWS